MTALAIVLVVVIVAASAGLVARQYRRWRGTRIVTCPKDQATAAVEVAALSATRASLSREPTLRLSDCSRWPEGADCGQACVQEIQAAPDDCLLRNILVRWYSDKACALCGKVFGSVSWRDHLPALITADGQILAWSEIASETVFEALAAHRPLCWDCQVAETFRKQYLDRVTER
jgi:type II secretory pathway pseudopilin PulG